MWLFIYRSFMAAQEVIHNLVARVRRLMSEHSRQLELCNRLTEENLALQKRNRSLEEQIKHLESELSRMQLVEGLSMNGPVRDQTRARVNRLMREVDRCIALLNRQEM
jgi:uncharacterized protein YlxW (UPF0749 family)